MYYRYFWYIFAMCTRKVWQNTQMCSGSIAAKGSTYSRICKCAMRCALHACLRSRGGVCDCVCVCILGYIYAYVLPIGLEL